MNVETDLLLARLVTSDDHFDRVDNLESIPTNEYR